MAKFKLDSKEALQEIKNLVQEIQALKKSTASFSSSSANDFKKIEGRINSLRTKVGTLVNRMNYMQAIIKKNNQVTAQNTKNVANNTKQIQQNSKAKQQNNKQTTQLSKSQKSFNLSLKNLVGGGLLLRGIQLLDRLALSTFENIKSFDSLSFTLKTITQDNFDYENSQRFLLRISKAYGVELINTTLRWSRFLAAAQESNLALRDTEQIFESVTKASAVLGLSTDELTSVYLALEQMLSKGKVTTEELRRQLGERLPGAMGIMAAAIGVTIPELDKMLKRGEVLSADVLPKFARALEQAYGIENADRIETLVAKQNRLTAAWQTFIKNISEGDSVIRKVIGGLIDQLSFAIDQYDYLFSNDQQRLRVDIGDFEKRFQDDLTESSARFIDLSRPVNEQTAQLNRLEKALLDEIKTASSERQKVISDELNEIARIRTLKGEEVLERNKVIANENIKIAFSEFKAAEAIYNEIRKEFEAVKAGELVNSRFNQEELEQARIELIKTTAQYNVFRKLVEESNVEVLPDENLTKTQRSLRQIKDYWLQIVNEIVGRARDAYKATFDDETINLKERLDALKGFVRSSVTIRKNEFEIIKKQTEERFQKETSSLEKSVEGGRLARQKANDQIKRLEKEKNDFIRLEALKLQTDLIDLNNQAAELARSTADDALDQSRISNIENVFDKRIIAAKEEFNQSKKTAKDRKKLEEELAKAAIQQTNAIINVKIKLLDEDIAVLEASGEAHSEYIEKLKRERDSLAASKQVPPPVDPDDWGKILNEALDLTQEFTNSIGDLFSARFDRRIEYINAEIDAEERKYEKLIELAENDEEQRAALERNREQRIEELERKRLKQQQKQAKTQKAFAVADIAISTAQAIMKIWANSPDFTGISQGVLTAVIAAIGAAQIATVLSTPIPQFKDGVKNLSKDQLGMINDGNHKEYIERKGRIFSTDKKNAVVDLKKGDTIYKNYQDMITNSDIFRAKNRATIAAAKSEKDLKDITKAVAKGISKASINNNLKVVVENNDYRDKMAKW